MRNHYEARRENYLISTDVSKLDVEMIHDYLCNASYWAHGIPRSIVERSIANSVCFGMYETDEQDKAILRQTGFARVITDKATFAYLADVFVLPAYRGIGLSKWLIATIHKHPELQGFRRWLLGTKDAHGLYERFGWKRLTEDVVKRFMQLHNPDVYGKSR